jgi:hypothetical protein
MAPYPRRYPSIARPKTCSRTWPSALPALPELAWLQAVGKLPDALFEQLDRWLEARLV